jgi:tetratricopeptide (TPR) repeat protein
MGLDRLREVELEVASELAARGPNLLLPLIAIHEQAHLEYWPQGLAADPFHARTTVYRQIELYSEHLETASDRHVASDLYVSLAGYFAGGAAGPETTGLYARALQYNPENSAALTGLALTREHSGRYRSALSLLERLQETGAANAENRLRLAMNLARLGKQGEAERLLDDITSQPGPDWVVSLAFQQLARERMDQGRFDSAHDYLARGLARFPEDQSLAIGLDYVEERLGRTSGEPRAAGRVTAKDSASARYRYARPGSEHITATRARLREMAGENLALLSRSLPKLPEGW